MRSAIRFIGLAVFVLLLAEGPGGTGCVEGGLNGNQQQPGNTDDGVDVGTGAIAVDPTGRYLLSRSGDKLVYAEIATGIARALDDLATPDRVAFGHDGRTLYATTESPARLVSYDLIDDTPKWSIATERDLTTGSSSYPLIAVTPDDQYVIVTEYRSVSVVAAGDGQRVRRMSFRNDIEDVDIHPDGATILVTLHHTWITDGPQTLVYSIDIATGRRSVISVPNCSSELTLLPDGTRAFIAPTTCQLDPVSIIDLTTNEWMRNLPGFGPVGVASDEVTLVAFMDFESADANLFVGDDPRPDPRVRYHLMFINADTLKFFLLPIGNSLPRYALTPSGKVLLVDSASYWADGRMRVVDIPARQLEELTGPDVRLDEFVITGDSQKLFLVDDGLFEVDVPDRSITRRGVHFQPRNLNITPDDQHLLVRESDDWIWVYGTQDGRASRAVWVGGAKSPSEFDRLAR